MPDFEIMKIAHPKAKTLLNEDFYWSPIEESGPFGNDDGSDAFYGFKKWRSANPKPSPLVYLHELIANWAYATYDLNTLDTVLIHQFISSNALGERLLRGQDNAIVAIGFGQFVIEGKIDPDIKELTKIALTRELLPIQIDVWDADYKMKRKEQLEKMLMTLNKID